MRLQVVAVGRLKAGPERDLAERYADRAAALARPLGFVGPEVIELPEGRAAKAPDRQADEGRRILQKTEGSVRILLDETAASPTSEAFATRLAAWRDAGRSCAALVIGGPDGTSPPIKEGADLAMSFGRLTLPHGLVRVLVLEQLYRALTILAGHPYHRAGSPGA